MKVTMGWIYSSDDIYKKRVHNFGGETDWKTEMEG
jgi:hypothetical protein